MRKLRRVLTSKPPIDSLIRVATFGLATYCRRNCNDGSRFQFCAHSYRKSGSWDRRRSALNVWPEQKLDVAANLDTVGRFVCCDWHGDQESLGWNFYRPTKQDQPVPLSAYRLDSCHQCRPADGRPCECQPC